MDAEMLIETQVAGLVRFFKNKVAGDVEDLVQETLARCLASTARPPGANVRAFVFGVARNVLYETLRAQYRHSGRVLDESIDSVADLAPGASTWIRQGNEKSLLLEALRRLPVEQQMMLEMFYWERLTARELATVMDAPEGTIWAKLHRSRRELARILGEYSAGALTASEEDLDAWATSLRRDWDP